MKNTMLTGVGVQSELRSELEAQRPLLRKAFFLGFVASLLVLVPTAYMFEVYGRVVDSRNPTTLLMLTLLALGALAVMELLEWSRAETLRHVGDRLESALMPRVYRVVFQLNLVRPGSASTQPIADLRTIRDFLPGPAIAALPELPAALVFLFILFAVSPALGVVGLAGALLQVGLAWGNERRTQALLAQANRLAISGQQQVDAMLRHTEVVRAMGMRSALRHRWGASQQDVLLHQSGASDRAGLFMALTKLTQTVVSSALLGVAAWLMLDNALWGGGSMLIVASVLGGRIMAPLGQAIAQWRQVVNMREAWKRLDAVLAQIPGEAAAMPLPAPSGVLTVEGVSAVAPASGQPILRNVQFALKPGEVLGVVGASASGKSTLARLLVGVWPAHGGKVRLDGADMFARDKQELGPHIGYLPQDVALLDGTLAENIARFGPVNPDAVRAAAQAVGIHDWIQTLSQGYDTLVGQEGARLSGGQRQRVGLARALYGSPVLVVLDEPNASLDEAGERALASAVTEQAKQGATFVLITHRTSVLQVCSHLLVLRDGVQLAFGLRDEVLASLKHPPAATATAARPAADPASQVAVPPTIGLAGGQA